jgi:hypothetical protein
MVDIQTVSIMLASASVIAGVVYYALQIRHQTKIRQTDLVMRLLSTFGSKEFQEAWTKTMSGETKDYEREVLRNWRYYYVNQVCVFFEEIGLLLHRKLIDISLVDDLLSAPIELTWEKMKPLTEIFRKQLGRPSIFEWFEYLYNEMKKREQRGVKNG